MVDLAHWKSISRRKKPPAPPTDPKIVLIRQAKTIADYSHGMGGLPRKHTKRPQPSLPRLKCLEDPAP